MPTHTAITRKALHNDPHLRASLPELGQAHGVGEEDARHGGHGPAAVGELSLAVPLQGLGVGAQAQGVKAVVAGCKGRSTEVREGQCGGQCVGSKLTQEGDQAAWP